MASSGKKGKKNKGTVISLQSFLGNGDTPAGVTKVAKKIRNVDGDDSDDGSSSLPMIVQLPTAPRAARIFDDDSISHKPPFIAYLTNLPYDADEDDIRDFFGGIPIVSLRLPREDGETGRVRGFGYAEFENRDDLIHVLSLPDPTIKGRRIRIDLSNENEHQNNKYRNRDGGNRRQFDGFGSNNNDNRESTNWRRDAQENNFNRDGPSSGGYGRDRGGDRDRDRESSGGGGGAGSWRTGNRNFDRSERDYRNDRGAAPEIVEERPKLNLKPRTLPLPEIITVPEEVESSKLSGEMVESKKEEDKPQPPKPSGVPSEKVFGSAKPVDTAAREMEIEQRLEEIRRQEQKRREEEAEAATAAASAAENEVNLKVSEIQLEKTEKEKENSAISWRRRADPVDDNKNDSRKYSPDRRHDNRRSDNRERDYNRRNNNRDGNDRSDMKRQDVQRSSKTTQPNNKDVKLRDDSKSKRDTKVERPLPKYQPQNQINPVLQSSNKYSGLDDEASD